VIKEVQDSIKVANDQEKIFKDKLNSIIEDKKA